jgi:hypothetical protein
MRNCNEVILVSANGLDTDFPPVGLACRVQAAWLRHDAIAGVTLAAYAIPVSLAYAGLAGLPPQVGIYGYMLGGLGLRAAWVVPPACGRPDLRNLAHDRRQRRGAGRRGRGTLRTDREPLGIRGGGCFA